MTHNTEELPLDINDIRQLFIEFYQNMNLFFQQIEAQDQLIEKLLDDLESARANK